MTDDELVRMAADKGGTEHDVDQVLRLAEFLRIMGPPLTGSDPVRKRTPEQAAYLADPGNREWMGLPALDEKGTTPDD